ncbi:unnamed protein product, partial [Mesorhabditis spiculigera]
MLKTLLPIVLFVGVAAEDCEEGWTTYKVMGSCYKMVNGQNFWNAEAECALAGAHLTSILSDEENQFVEGMISKHNPGGDAWVGGYLMTRNVTQFHWMDGTLVDVGSIIWNKGRKPDSTSKMHCLRKNGNGSLEQQFCDQQNKAICKRPIGQAAVKLETPKCDEGWKGSKWTGSCYKLTPSLKSGAAQEQCLGWNATLASALTFLEKEFILEMTKEAEHEDCWLGAKRGADGAFDWLDGSEWDYGFWSPDVPSPKDTTKNCLVLCNSLDQAVTTMHRYYEDDCNKEMVGMCKKAGNKEQGPAKE